MNGFEIAWKLDLNFVNEGKLYDGEQAEDLKTINHSLLR